MTARMRRLASDYEQVRKDFAGHKSIIVTPVGSEPPEKYHVTYFVSGIYLQPDGSVTKLARHEVDITLHSDYPRYKPICTIQTPIWHPNFRDGQICIGDIWGAGESLTDIIVNIGDMIQYKSWNSSSPLCADAAKWALENRHLFPVGNIELNVTDYESAADIVEIDLFDGSDEAPAEESAPAEVISDTPAAAPAAPVQKDVVFIKPTGNDFEITAEELAGITFVPTEQRMHVAGQGGTVRSGSVNFKTIFTKGLLWALIGGILGFVLQELLDAPSDSMAVLKWMGYDTIADLIPLGETKALAIIARSVRISSAIFSASIACMLGLFMGVGEGVFYGSKENTAKFAGIGAGISVALGFISGYLAQMLYSALLENADGTLSSALVRGFGWAIMGLGVGVAIGLIRPEKRRILYCGLGGLGGGFIGGFLFNFIVSAVRIGEDDTGVIGRAIGIVIMCLLIGLGIGLLEQFAKQAWLKVIRGEFEGKEYLVFSGTTSIGNNGKNSIVLFKDKLVGPHHCDIILEGSKYILVDCGTPMGTVVNGMRVTRCILKQGDTIAIGNSVLVFSTK